MATAPLIVVSSGLSDEQAAECMRLGATDYILMDRLGRLPHALTKAIHHARDSSERREAGLELTESEERLSSLLSGAPVAIATLDTDGRITFAGGSVFSDMGVDPPSILGLVVTDVFSDRLDLLELWTRALEHELQTDVEFGGHTFHLRCGPFRLTSPGEVIGVRAVALDITEGVEAVEIYDNEGHKVTSLPLTPPDAYVVPAGKVMLAALWKDSIPQSGNYRAQAKVTILAKGLPVTTLTSGSLEISFFSWAPVLVRVGIVICASIFLTATWSVVRRGRGRRLPRPSTIPAG